jgi:hypothetical protein
VFSYFDNDVKSAAPRDARLLIEQVAPASGSHRRTGR